MKFWHCLAPAALGAAVGFKKPIAFISTGYGAAIALQGVAALASGRGDLLGRLHLAAVTAHGARMAGFVLWRDTLGSFQQKKQSYDKPLASWGLAKKLSMWCSVTPLYWAMFNPAFLNSAAGAGAAASPAMRALSLYVGAPLMLAALVWEQVADFQQQKHYERQKDAAVKKPCMTGLWSLSRQANYFGETTFWLANYVTALRSFTSRSQALGAAIGVASITLIMVTESIRRAAERDNKYSGEWYEQYKRDVAQIVPFAHWIRSEGELGFRL